MQISPAFPEFETAYGRGASSVVWARIAADLDTPVSLMMKFTGGRDWAFLQESVSAGETRGRYSIIGLKPDLLWRCRDGQAQINRCARHEPDAFVSEARDPLSSLRALLSECAIALPEDLPPMAAGLFGYFGYDMARVMQSLPEPNPDPLDQPDAILMRPTLLLVADAVKDEVTIVAPVWARDDRSARAAYSEATERLTEARATLERAPGRSGAARSTRADARSASAETEREQFCEAVIRAQGYIRAGEIVQVVLSQRWDVPLAVRPFDLYRALRRTSPSPYMFFFDLGGFQIVGASPETLVKVSGRRVTLRSAARMRRSAPGENRHPAADALANPEEPPEQERFHDQVRREIGRAIDIEGDADGDQLAEAEDSHVLHLASSLAGRLRDDQDALAVLLAGLPAGAVTGAPKRRAMEIIDELEGVKRGIFGGCIGYFSSGGDLDLCVALRTAVVKDGVMHVQAGAGIDAESEPEAKREETEHNATGLMRAAREAYRFGENA